MSQLSFIQTPKSICCKSAVGEKFNSTRDKGVLFSVFFVGTVDDEVKFTKVY